MLRTGAGLSLADLARLCHFSVGHISNVENGTKPASMDFARACDEALQTGGTLVGMLAAEVHRAHPHNVKPAQLPPLPQMVGRAPLMRALKDVLDLDRLIPTTATTAQLIALDGQAGVGKTTVAVGLAHLVKHRFPDGILFVDLHGYAAGDRPVDTNDVLEDFLRVLGVRTSDIPTSMDRRAAMLRSVLDGSRLLLVLDNAATVEQVRPLIPAAAGCAVVVTSRRRLSGLAVYHGAQYVTVEPFEDNESLALLRDVVGPDRMNAEPDAAERIAAFCSGLPLAIRVAAERVASHRHLTLTALADELADIDRRLDALSPHDAHGAVRAVFSWSVRALEPEAARLFRLLSMHPGRHFGIEAAAALTGGGLAETSRLLDVLCGGHLLEEDALGRYRFHDLLRAYASERAAADEPAAAVAESVQRMLRWYLLAAHTANQVTSPHRPQQKLVVHEDIGHLRPVFGSACDARQWSEVELRNVASAARRAAELDFHEVALGLPVVLADYLYWRKPWTVWMPALSACLAVAREAGKQDALAWILNNLGNAHLDQRTLDDASTCYAEALEIRRRLDDLIGQLWSHIGLGRTLQAGGQHEAAALHYLQAQGISAERDDRWAWAITTSYLGDTYRARGQYDNALHELEQGVAVLQDLGDQLAESCALDKIADVHRDRGDWQAALEYLNRALTFSANTADLWSRATVLRKLGFVHLELGDPASARSAWEEALVHFEELGDRRALDIQAEIDALGRPDASTPRRTG
ncbi:tetratricopeptide (TPR) repeat protein [Umezawaea tangerina]|uniref:Tetratricopeptide (TPR) repeat protein n=2 Tax=Umezawaea tangerina TaxID=84725 RepID=A0A2T0S700_9PSEU|nr:tetratricopeptide (TPR) repeat protein [Umezawaea tangerina]